ncbi:MAG: hypothetical protein HY287_10900 [Planctomycetes bacterium]|nr:hypothetical protein [Planctomycetota bacterium]
MHHCGLLSEGMDIVHVVAHADLGGEIDGCWIQIMGDVLHCPVEERQSPKRGSELLDNGLCEANFLLFAIACSWISSLTYVYHADRNADPTSDEVPRMYFRNNSYLTRELQLKSVTKEDINGIKRPWDMKPLHIDPPVPYQATHPDRFRSSGSFNYMFLTYSPNYTPSSADSLISLISSHIAPMR